MKNFMQTFVAKLSNPNVIVNHGGSKLEKTIENDSS